MLKALSLALLLAISSPALAATKAPVAKCLTPEAAIKAIPPNMKLIAQVTGDELARLNALQPNTIPEGVDLMVVAGEPDAQVYVMVVFKGGCALGSGGVTKAFLAKRLGETL